MKSLGSKPAELVWLERQVWELVFSVMKGGNPENQLADCMKKLEDMVKQGCHRGLDWFSYFGGYQGEEGNSEARRILDQEPVDGSMQVDGNEDRGRDNGKDGEEGGDESRRQNVGLGEDKMPGGDDIMVVDECDERRGCHGLEGIEGGERVSEGLEGVEGGESESGVNDDGGEEGGFQGDKEDSEEDGHGNSGCDGEEGEDGHDKESEENENENRVKKRRKGSPATRKRVTGQNFEHSIRYGAKRSQRRAGARPRPTPPSSVHLLIDLTGEVRKAMLCGGVLFTASFQIGVFF
jgi:hypothetical protein